MSSVFTLDDDPIVLVVPAGASIPPGNITEAEWLSLKNRVTVVEGYGMADLSDIDLSGISDGDVLIWDSDAQVWEPGSSTSPVAGWDDDVGRNTIVADVRQIVPRNGLVGVASGVNANRYILDVVTGTTATTVAAGNHTHRLPAYERADFGPTGYMSGGTRQLATQSVVLASGVQYRIVARMKPQMRGADAGAAYYRMTINIDGLSRTSPPGTDGYWCVQGVPNKEEFTVSVTRTGTGAAITVTASVAYHSGAGFNVDAGELEVMAFAAR